MKKIKLLLLTLIVFSCGENTMKVDEKKEDNLFNGFYERIGTVQYVKGIAVDTVYYKDLEDSPRQVKAYFNGITSWLSNNPIPKQALETGVKMPWQSGQGSYGTYEYSPSEDESEMIETNLSTIGNSLLWGRGSMRDSLLKAGKFTWAPFYSSFTGEYYNQRWKAQDTASTSYSELYIKKEESEATDLDGVWKRIANVRYINDVPVDTIAVPEGLDDYKVYIKGNVIVNVDPKNAKQGDPFWGGAGLLGKFSYIDGTLTEKFDMSTGNWEYPGGKWPDFVADIDWIDDDTFIQINRYIGDPEGRGMIDAKKEKNGLLHVRIK